jgi:SPP1 gp7 family putative phage head morphogenesis protein
MPKRRHIPTNKRPKTPDVIESRYVRDLTKVWKVAQAIIAWGMAPLIEKWPNPREDGLTGGQSWAECLFRQPLIEVVGEDWPEKYGRKFLLDAITTDEDDRGETEEERVARELGEWFEAQAAAEAALAAGLSRRKPGAPRLVRPEPATVTREAIHQQSVFVRLLLERWLGGNPAGPAIDTTAGQVDRFALGQLRQVLAIDLRREVPGMQDIIDQFREANIQLIESGIMAPKEAVQLRNGLLPDVSEVIEQAHAQGLRVEELQAKLVQRFGVSDARAELIARDQVLKLNGEVSRHRQRQAGIVQYIWSTSRDMKVRPSHAELEGKTFDINTPPLIEGRPLHPGEDYQCRCIAAPVKPDWMNAEQ